MTHRSLPWLSIAVLAVVVGGPAAAQQFYRWTDAHGVVHDPVVV
jgi:hypothetical protein